MSGTNIAFGATRVLCHFRYGHAVQYCRSMRALAMSSTDTVYAKPVPTQRMELCVCYAMHGTNVWYRATRFGAVLEWGSTKLTSEEGTCSPMLLRAP
eukprot:2954765-Rhodomonas_salina.4